MELFLIKDILDQSIQEKKIYCFSNYSDDSFYCGYVLSYNTDSVQIRHYDRYGQTDGTISLAYNSIRTISIDGMYINRIKYLIEHQEAFRVLSDLDNFLLSSTSEGFLPILRECQNDRNKILKIETGKESYIGFVEDIIGETNLIFTEIDNEGFIYETAIYKIEDISSVAVNDRISLRNLLLYRWRNNSTSN